MRSAVSRSAAPRLRAAAIVIAAAALGLSACDAGVSDAGSVEVTYKIVVTGSSQKQVSAVAYYTAPQPSKDSVRADAGTVMLKPVEGKQESLWETTTTVTKGKRIEITAAPASSQDTVSCVVLEDGNASLSETAEAGQPVTCSNQPDAPARR